MFDILTKNPSLGLLKKEHRAIKKLFDKFEQARDRRTRSALARQVILELKVHAAIEAELFYPAIGQRLGAEIINDADDERRATRVLIAELDE